MRKIIQFEQIARGNDLTILALCDDGTMWILQKDVDGWVQILNIPQ